jgi:lactate dehydrogenase-like 2-hydroxyacid dehydrogenase
MESIPIAANRALAALSIVFEWDSKRTAMANLAIDNIDEFFNTGNCKNKVN